MVGIAFPFVRCVRDWRHLLLDDRIVAGCYMVVYNAAAAHWIISVTARSPLVWTVTNEAPAKNLHYFYVHSVSHNNDCARGDLPWIIKALRITARVVRFATVVPGADLTTIQFAWIEARYEIFFARRTNATPFARHGEVMPRTFTFVFWIFEWFSFGFIFFCGEWIESDLILVSALNLNKRDCERRKKWVVCVFVFFFRKKDVFVYFMQYFFTHSNEW